MKSKPKIKYIDYRIEHQRDLDDKLATLREWYNRHELVDKVIIEEQAKKFILEHVKVKLVEEE